MRKSKEEKDREKLAALLGVDPPKKSIRLETESTSREAEAVLAYAQDYKQFSRKICKECKRPFVHSRGAVACCSDECRAKGLAKIGIEWHWLKPQSDRWGRTEPLVVPPEALAVIDSLPEWPPPKPEPEPEPTPLVPTELEQDVLDILGELGIE